MLAPSFERPFIHKGFNQQKKRIDTVAFFLPSRLMIAVQEATKE